MNQKPLHIPILLQPKIILFTAWPIIMHSQSTGSYEHKNQHDSHWRFPCLVHAIISCQGNIHPKPKHDMEKLPDSPMHFYFQMTQKKEEGKPMTPKLMNIFFLG
jgi:hypothetical protein